LGSSFFRRMVIQRWAIPTCCLSFLLRHLLLHGSWMGTFFPL